MEHKFDMSTKHERIVSSGAPMPKGYGFLKKGNPYLTALCRRKTHEAKKPLYVVMNKSKPEGLRAPKWILGEIYAEERATRERRRTAVEKKDAATQETFEDAILELFPKMPKADLTIVLKRTLKKRSGRVGRTGKLDLNEKAHLAVQAHVRHCHTKYDNLMNGTVDRATARRTVHAEITRVLTEWGGRERSPRPGKGSVLPQKRKTGTMAVPRTQALRPRLGNNADDGIKRVRIDRRRLSKRNASQIVQAPTTRKSSERADSAQGSAVIDLTLDDTDELDDDDDDDESQISSELSAQEEVEIEDIDDEDDDEDDLYELSDMVDSTEGSVVEWEGSDFQSD